jgi:hypothetical protein
MVSWGLRPPRGSAALRHEPPLHRLRRVVLSHDREKREKDTERGILRLRAAKSFAKAMPGEDSSAKRWRGGAAPHETVSSAVVGAADEGRR